MLGAFYSYGKDIWGATENLYEAIFSLIASVIITIMGIAMLRVSKMQEKWQVKIQAALETSNTQIGWGGWRSYGKKYAMFLLPFITVLREGLEGVIFVGGVGVNEPATAFPLPVFTGIAAGSIIGIFIYRGGNTVKLQWFLVASTCVLYLVAAGLLSKSAWFFDMYAASLPSIPARL